MIGDDDPCNTALSLGRAWELWKQPAVRYDVPLPPCPQEEEGGPGGSRLGPQVKDAGSCGLRLGTMADREEDMVHGGSSSGGHAEGNGEVRMKLRLSREQLLLLEHAFRQSKTVTAFEKQELAEKLDLLPRQVEVWFQNKRARTKLKQTEVEREILRKCCESLNDENQRLKEELQELSLVRRGFLLHTQEAKLAMCPSCKRLSAGNTGASFDNDDTAAAELGKNDGSRGEPANMYTSSISWKL